MSCTTTCLAGPCASPKQILPGAIFAPYVNLSLGNGKTTLTVGNQSQPSSNNHMAIKSMEYGFAQGAVVKIEMIDVEGSAASDFMAKLSKTAGNADADFIMQLDFGWIYQDCMGNVRIDKASDYGNEAYFLPMTLNTALEGGKIKYTLEGVDFHQRIVEDKRKVNIGTLANQVPLKQAIVQLFSTMTPQITATNIRFVAAGDKGVAGETPFMFKNRDGGKDGPKSVWPVTSLNAFAVVREWIKNLVTTNDKGVVLKWKQNEPQPVLLIMEDPVSICANENCCLNNIGTYIVGGDCSPVLSFSPDAKWVLTGNPGKGGFPGGSATGKKSGIQENPVGCANVEKKGFYVAGALGSALMNWRNPDDQPILGAIGNAAHLAATRIYEVPMPIEAELKLVGDASLSNPLFTIASNVSIIVINPFYINSESNGSCNWLVKSPCNSTFTSKSWRINGINHQIREGSFTTTLKIFLDAPNAGLNQGDPIGGGCGNIAASVSANSVTPTPYK